MPIRLEPFANNEIYHVFNKTIDNRLIFKQDDYCSHFLNLIEYYRSNETKFSYSQLCRLDPLILNNYLKRIGKLETFRINLISYCLMPTHFHFLIKQKKDKGISRFIADIINALTRYFNIRAERKGPIFLSDFKSVRITNEAQFMHVSRYIHLNPYSSGIVKRVEELENYQWSSYKGYIYKRTNKLIICKDLLSIFGYDRGKYKRFVISNAEHQRTLEEVKYTSKW